MKALVRSRHIDLVRVGNTAAVLVAIAALCTWASGFGRPGSVVAGGAVMLANYHLIRMLVSRLIAPLVSKFRTLLLFTLKLLLFFALLAGAFLRLPIEPMSFAFGATQLLAALVVEAVFLGEAVAESLDSPGEAE